MTIRLILFFSLVVTSIWSQKSLLQSGPMLGFSEMREVMLWVQTKSTATVQIAYWIKSNPERRWYTQAKKTHKEKAYTVKLLADEVQPGEQYAYELRINDQVVKLDYLLEFNTQPIWKWRTDPPDFTLAAGSCAYINESPYDRPGPGYGDKYQIFTSIHQIRPDLMLWLGDNVYLREPDWYSRTGILHRYTHTRSLPELQPLLASTHHYAIWDDHEFGPNNADRSFIHKDLTLEAFKLFWANPTFGLPGRKGITTFFQYGDIDFFLLDDRYYRSPNDRITTEATILGKEQLEWLIDALAFSQAPFKIVVNGGQVLNSAEIHETYAHKHKAEQQYLLQRIEEENIRGVIFLTGDRHHSELSRYETRVGIPIYDLTISPLTAGPSKTVDEVNVYRVEGTLVTQRNFGLLSFSGPRKERKLLIQVFDSDGKELWRREILADK